MLGFRHFKPVISLVIVLLSIRPALAFFVLECEGFCAIFLTLALLAVPIGLIGVVLFVTGLIYAYVQKRQNKPVPLSSKIMIMIGILPSLILGSIIITTLQNGLEERSYTRDVPFTIYYPSYVPTGQKVSDYTTFENYRTKRPIVKIFIRNESDGTSWGTITQVDLLSEDEADDELRFFLETPRGRKVFDTTSYTWDSDRKYLTEIDGTKIRISTDYGRSYKRGFTTGYDYAMSEQDKSVLSKFVDSLEPISGDDLIDRLQSGSNTGIRGFLQRIMLPIELYKARGG